MSDIIQANMRKIMSIVAQISKTKTALKWLIILFLVICSNNLISQNYVRINENARFENYGKDVNYIKQYLDNNIDNISPIEGIWSVNNTVTANGIKNSSQGETQIAIIRNSNSNNDFIIVVIERTSQSHQLSGTKNYDIVGECKSTTNDKIFISKYYKGRTEITNFPYTSNLIMINDGLLTSSAEYFMGQIYCTIKEEYIKTYPIRKAKPKVKEIKRFTGTGFSINNKGYILTNYHVIENANKISVRGINLDFSNRISCEIYKIDKKNDLAIIRIIDSTQTNKLSYPIYFDNRSLDLGESINSLGFPMTSTMGEQIKYSNGIISSKSGFQDDITSYTCSLPIQPGNSGGPLFDSNGNIVGIINAKHREAENTTYAIKSSYIINFISESSIKFQAARKNIPTQSITTTIKNLSPYVYIIECEILE
jgi:S1-C subfamily serine protease